MRNDSFAISPLEFLKGIVAGEYSGTENLTVNGDLDLRAHPLRKLVTQLPRATILGDLGAGGGKFPHRQSVGRWLTIAQEWKNRRRIKGAQKIG